nr:twin-arginine translocation signal domain-containing protein [Solemya velesiana gill symbiont]
MSEDKSKTSELSRRGFIKVSAAAMAAASSPMFFVEDAWAKDFRNNPGNASSVKLGR